VYNLTVILEWDERKRKANLEKHGLDFTRAIDILNSDVLEFIDDREDYEEERIVAIGLIEGIAVVLVYTLRGDAHRIISLRKAESHEERAYFEAIHG
jgi:uncharacterized protein